MRELRELEIPVWERNDREGRADRRRREGAFRGKRDEREREDASQKQKRVK